MHPLKVWHIWDSSHWELLTLCLDLIFSHLYICRVAPLIQEEEGDKWVFPGKSRFPLSPLSLTAAPRNSLSPPTPWLNCTLPPLVVHLRQSVPLILPGQSFYPCSSLSTSTYIFVDRRWCIWSFVCKILFLKPNQFSHSGIAQCTGLIQNDKRKFLWENPAIRVCKACHLSIKPGPCM